MIIRHSLFYLAANGLPAIINFVALALYTRWLNPEQYGTYALTIAGIGISNTICFWWLRLGLLRMLPAYGNERGKFLSTLVACFLMLVSITSCFGLALAWMVDDTSFRWLIVLGTILLGAQAWFELNLELLRSELSPTSYGVHSLSRAIICLAFGGLFVWHGLGAEGLLIGTIVGVCVSIAPLTYRAWRGVSHKMLDTGLIFQLLAFGAPLAMKFALDLIANFAGRFFLAALVTAEAAGLYSASYDLAQQTIGVIITIIYLAAYPLIVRALDGEGTDAARKKLSEYSTLLLVVICPSIAGFSLLSENIAQIFFVKDFYVTAVEILPWLALSALFAGVKTHYFDLGFQLARETKPQILVSAASAGTSVMLNLLLVPIHGIMGAILATIAANLIGLFLSWIVGRKRFGLPRPNADDAKVIVATFVMTMALWPFLSSMGAVSLVAKVMWGLAVYGTLIISMNVLGLRLICSNKLRDLDRRSKSW